MEIWKDIKGYEGLYQMSNYKRVRRKGYSVSQKGFGGKLYTRNFKEKYLEPNVDSQGYLYYNIGGDRIRLHWLYYNTFIGDSTGFFIDHIDRNKLNNDESNLRLLTHQESNKNRTLPYKPPIINMNKYYSNKHTETRGGLSKPYELSFSENGKRKKYYFATYEEAENKYRELYNERQKRIDDSTQIRIVNN